MNGFKADFVQYLRDNNLLERVDQNKNDANINAQKYDQELTDFLKDYKVDENELVEAAIDVDEILSMDFDNIANVVVKDDNIAQGKDVVGGLFNFLINQNDIKAQVDKDGDGAFSKAEIADFAKTVASKDGDASNFTLKDMLDSYQQMQDKNFKVGEFDPMGGNLFNSAPPETPQEVRPTATTTITVASLAGKSKEDLDAQKNDEQTILEDNQKAAQDALSGEGAEPSNDDVDKSYYDYLDLVASVNNEKNQFSQKLTEKNTQISDKRNEIHTRQMQAELENETCMQLDVAVNDAKSAYDSALENLSNAKNALNSLAKPPANASMTQIRVYENRHYQLQAAIQEAQDAVEKANAELEAKEKEYEVAVDKYNESLTVIAQYQEELNILCTELATLQDEIAKANADNAQQLQNAANTWNSNLSANEQSRQENFKVYSENAQRAASNVALINEAINDLPQES